MTTAVIIIGVSFTNIPKGISKTFLIRFVIPRILESLAGCRTMFLFAGFCQIGALERNAY